MAPGVVLHGVSRVGHQLRQLGLGGHFFADLEERGGYPILLQNRHNLGGERTRTVVKGECDHLLAGRALAAGRLVSVEGRLRTDRRRAGHERAGGQRGHAPRHTGGGRRQRQAGSHGPGDASHRPDTATAGAPGGQRHHPPRLGRRLDLGRLAHQSTRDRRPRTPDAGRAQRPVTGCAPRAPAGSPC